MKQQTTAAFSTPSAILDEKSHSCSSVRVMISTLPLEEIKADPSVNVHPDGNISRFENFVHFGHEFFIIPMVAQHHVQAMFGRHGAILDLDGREKKKYLYKSEFVILHRLMNHRLRFPHGLFSVLSCTNRLFAFEPIYFTTSITTRGRLIKASLPSLLSPFFSLFVSSFFPLFSCPARRAIAEQAKRINLPFN